MNSITMFASRGLFQGCFSCTDKVGIIDHVYEVVIILENKQTNESNLLDYKTKSNKVSGF